MGVNSALRARLKHSKKNTKIGRLIKKHTRDLRRKGKLKY